MISIEGTEPMSLDQPWAASELLRKEPERVARYRRLQSWYRHVVLGVRPGVSQRGNPVGNEMHPDDVAERPDLNFLDERAAAHATERGPVVRAEGGQLQEHRLRHNLLSSMPMCFNLFGSIGSLPGFAEVLRTAFGLQVHRVTNVLCEWTPLLREQYLGDHSAFDAAVWYDDPDGRRCLLGIETKYTDSFSREPYSRARYREVYEACGWFQPDGYGTATTSACNQVTRLALLAATVELAGDVDRASVTVVGLDEDPTIVHAVDMVRSVMRQPDRLTRVGLQRVIELARATPDVDLRSWADRFEQRYLDLTPVARL